ncbi:MAG: TraB family protein [Methanobrevibacter sp.]|jgi:pheromone shutdown-related protein TraB|nr:TraB family protein [Candidatus Methanovirga aequatorialis]
MRRECLKIIGTAHVSKESVEEVKDAIYNERPEVVAIELDYSRFIRLMEEKNSVKKEEKSMGVAEVVKEKKIGVYVTSGILSFMQSRIGAELDIKPGSEMIAAIDAGYDIGAEVALIDRDINVTLQRAINKMSIYEKLKFVFSLIYSMFSRGDELENIEDLKKQETLEEVMEYFKKTSPSVYEVIVQERDAYLAKSILNIEKDHVIAVVGAGHKKGINHYLNNPEEIPPIKELTDTQKSGFPWMKLILILIVILIILTVLKLLNLIVI